MSPRAAPSRAGERAAALAADDAGGLAAALVVAPVDAAGVHEARKCVRRLRSLLALGRRALGRERVDAIDHELRALARGLSALRDGQVVQDTARRLARDADDADDADETSSWDALLPLLAQHQHQRLADALREDPGFIRRQALAHRLAEQLQRLPWHRVHGDDLNQALARSRRRQADAQAVALASGRADDLHDWRRRSRRLRMQLSALRKLRVSARAGGHDVTPSLRHVARLVDELGVLQDLALLRQALDALERAEAPAARPPARHRKAKPVQLRPLG
ncbi:CHAD domain-containing protein [Pseudoxanthomonas sp.]|uniref:CHAD domain-containing protein n=1 Tax=Pseudoxanthomonas sp. TaxID=1871049 RepID=UPI002FDFC733